MKINGTLAPSWPSGWMTDEMPIFDWPKMAAIFASVPGLSTTLSRTKYCETTSAIGATAPGIRAAQTAARDAGRAEFQIQRRVGEVAQHRAGGGVLARAASVKQRVADDVAADEHGVEDMVHAGEHVRIRDQASDKPKPARGRNFPLSAFQFSAFSRCPSSLMV